MNPLHEKVKKGLEELAEKNKCALSCNNIDGTLHIDLRSSNPHIAEIYAELKITKEGDIIDDYNMEDTNWIKYREEHPNDTVSSHPSEQLKIIQYCKKIIEDYQNS